MRLLIALSHMSLLAVYEYDIVGATFAIYLSVPPEKDSCGISLNAFYVSYSNVLSSAKSMSTMYEIIYRVGQKTDFFHSLWVRG